MAGRFLLDTSVVVALLRNDEHVRAKLAVADEVLLPSIAAGELLYGAALSANAVANAVIVESVISSTVMLPCDLETARHYAAIKKALRDKGKPIPENDIWIAAIAIQHGLALATRDIHFSEVSSLLIAQW
jgi:tRNA(fMet)-specific endonuclease VapC